MCLYTKYITNPKYLPNKKNNYKPPACKDRRLLYVPVKCGKCMECRKQNQSQWIVRLSEEIKKEPEALFVTLTFNEESYKELAAITKNENEMCRIALRRMLENYRVQNKRTIKHWVATELGDDGRIHMHGIFWTNKEVIEKYWKYGFIFIGTWVNEQTIFYITKYIMKVSTIDKNFTTKILCSKGIGSSYLKRGDVRNNRYKKNDTDESYRLRDGRKISLPDYYKRKIYSEEEREKLWIEKQERGYRYIMGEKVDVDNEQEYFSLLNFYREKAKRILNEKPQDWDKEKHKKQLKKLKEYRQRFKGGC